jgi:acetyltransferase-like isoleucine patch superfamily enzyme
MSHWRRTIALSDHPAARLARKLYWGLKNLTLPAPQIIVKPMLWIFLAIRSIYYFVMRVFICEPLFKAYCAQYGQGVRTDVFIHWVQGKGEIILGDHVLLDGKSTFGFTSRYADRPTLQIGDHTYVGSGCTFSVGRRITIGRHCLLAGGVWIADSNGHSTDPAARLAGQPPRPEEVRPVEIGDNVWIASRAIILPGTTIGEGSVVAAASVVRGRVAPYTIVAGNPAVKVADLNPPADREPGPKPLGPRAVAVAAGPPEDET